MADWTIQSKTTLSAVDRASDLLVIADASASNAVRKTTVNSLLDLTSHPVGIDDSQTLTNKTLGNTNTVTIKDTLFTLQDDSDTTKQAKFQLSGITTATTRTYTLPDASTTIVGTDATQTLTNKTLTSPTINTATISNPTLTIDTIAEYTGANGVTIDGVNIKDGALVTSNSVVAANITDAAVTPAKLLAGTGSSWSWQDWTPTLTNLSGGTQTYAKYIQIGKTVHFRFKYTLAGAGVSGSLSFTLPVTAATGDGPVAGMVEMLDTGTAIYPGIMLYTSTTAVTIRPFNAAGTYLAADTTTSSTIPHTWANTDIIYATGTYEAA